MAAANSQEIAELASLETKYCLTGVLERSYKSFYDNFVTEVFDFYLINEEMWPVSEESPLYDLLETRHFPYFSIPARKAVITLAYLFRKTYRRYFDKALRHLENVEVFKELVLGYSLNKEPFFPHFLTWIAYLCELNLYCRFHNFDYAEICKSCFSSYPGLSYIKEGGLQGLAEACNFVSGFYSSLTETLHERFPSCDILLPFIHTVGIVDRHFKYDNTINKIVLLHNSVDAKCKNLSKFHALASYNPIRIILGYRNRIVRQDKSENFSKEASKTGEHLPVTEETQESTEVSLSASSRNVTPNQKSPVEFDDKNSFFVVTSKYLLKRQEAGHNAYNRYIKIFSPLDGAMLLMEGLMNVLDENIEKNNLYQITDEVFAVYPSNNDHKSDKIIVLDTSSEDDDVPQFDHRQWEFMRDLMPKLPKWKLSTANKNKRLKQLRETYEKRKFKEKCKPLREKEIEINMENTGAIPKQRNSTEQNLEKKKKKPARKTKEDVIPSIESTEERMIYRAKEFFAINFETNAAYDLPGNRSDSNKNTGAKQNDFIESILENRKDSNKNTGAKQNDFIESILENRRDSNKNTGAKQNNFIESILENSGAVDDPILKNTLLAFKKLKKKLEDSIATEKVPANTRRDDISINSTGAKGKNSVRKNPEKSETAIADAQEEISVRNTEAIKKKRNLLKDAKILLNRHLRNKIAPKSIQLATEGGHMVNTPSKRWKS